MEQIQSMFSYYFSHGYLQAITVILLTIVSVFIARKLMYEGVNKYVTHTLLKKKIIPLLEKPIFYTLSTQGFSIALALLNLNEKFEKTGLAVLNTLLFIIWTLFFLKAVKILIHKAAKMKSIKFIKNQTVPLFDNFSSTIIWVISIFSILSLWGDTSKLLASIGIMGIAIGMAAKDTLANFISGVLILADSPYKIGDYLILENGDRGKVTRIGLRSTSILTRDDVELTVPNSLMEGSKIKNESAGGHSYTRIRVNISVAYGSDLDAVEKILLEIANKEEKILKDPEARVRWRGFGASSMDAQLMGWINDPEGKGITKHMLIKKIYSQFAEEKIEIPYSKQELFIKELPQG